MIRFDRGRLGPSYETDSGRLVSLSLQSGERVGAPNVTVLDCAWSDAVTLRPGAVNAHTHLYSGLAPLGLPAPAEPPQNFVQILERVWWKLDRALDDESLRAAARYAIADGLLQGTTALVDHHESPNLISGSLEILADAAQELGCRLAVGYGVTERNFGRDEAKRGLAECEWFLQHNTRSLVTGMVAIHASFTVSDDTLREAGELARRFGAPMHVHIAEDLADVVDARQRGYEGPLERLLTLGALPEGSIVAHGVHLSPQQVQLARQNGLWLVQNPRSNEGNKVGYASSLRASNRVALGTDGWPSHMEVEAAALRRLGPAHGDSEAVIEARLRAGHELGSELFRQRLGEITDSATADVVVGIPGERPRHVIVGGRRVVLNGRLVTADFEDITARAREAAAPLWRRMNEL